MNIITHIDDIDLSSIACKIESVAIDTETMGLMPHRDRLCVVQMCFGDNDVHIVQTKNYVKADNIRKILANTSVQKIFHYARFDIMMLYHYLGTMADNVYCTKIASKLCRTYSSSHGLNALCQELVGCSLAKSETHTDWSRDVLTQKQLEYAAYDVFYLHRIRDKLNEMLERNNRTEMAKKCFDFMPTRCMLDLMVGDHYDIFSHS